MLLRKNNTTTNYIRGVSGIISSSIQGTNNTTKYYLSDGHGNVTNLTDSSGAIVKTYSYDAFGVEESIDSSDANPFRYCGEYYDSEIGQIYLRARYYDPTVGRFTQSDPAMSGANWYVYCSNNPILFVDPSGLSNKPEEEDYPDATKYYQDLIAYTFEEGAPKALDFERDSAYNQALSEYNQQILFLGLSLKNATKDSLRVFWATGAELYLRRRGYTTATWLLEHSLQDNPSDVYRDNDSNIARLINNDSNFNQKVMERVNRYKFFHYFPKNKIDVFFSSGDLAASIYHCNDITLEGWRQRNGSWVIHVSLHDVYDFTEILTMKVQNGEVVFNINSLTIANDLANLSQQLGAINPYDIYVDFWITRWV